jgi:hypothetical protein
MLPDTVHAAAFKLRNPVIYLPEIIEMAENADPGGAVSVTFSPPATWSRWPLGQWTSFGLDKQRTTVPRATSAVSSGHQQIILRTPDAG